MKSKLIKAPEEKDLMTFSDCLRKTGVYKRQDQDDEHLVVIHEQPNVVYFGMYSNGDVFPHVDCRGINEEIYKRLGDIELIVKVMGEGGE